MLFSYIYIKYSLLSIHLPCPSFLTCLFFWVPPNMSYYTIYAIMSYYFFPPQDLQLKGETEIIAQEMHLLAEIWGKLLSFLQLWLFLLPLFSLSSLQEGGFLKLGSTPVLCCDVHIGTNDQWHVESSWNGSKTISQSSLLFFELLLAPEYIKQENAIQLSEKTIKGEKSLTFKKNYRKALFFMLGTLKVTTVTSAIQLLQGCLNCLQQTKLSLGTTLHSEICRETKLSIQPDISIRVQVNDSQAVHIRALQSQLNVMENYF